MNQTFLLIFGAVGYAIIQIVWTVTNPNGISIKQGIRSFITGTVGRLIFFLFVLNMIGGWYFHWPETGFDFAVRAVGLCFFVFGMFLAIWAKLIMKGNWNVPAVFESKRQKKLVTTGTTGPFGFSRNPIYLCTILMILGHGLFLRSLFLPVLAIFCIHIRKLILIEEKHLADHFGKEYEEYKNRVPRFL